MEFVTGCTGREDCISELFFSTFAAAESVEEGEIIRGLVADLMTKTPPEDVFAFSAVDAGALIGCIFFSRLTYEQDDQVVFILSPAAVTSNRQNQGVGQDLISFGLTELRRRGIDVVVTYGDPNYYTKVGFEQISESVAQAPLALTQPQGWMGQSLSSGAMKPLAGPSQCVEALNKPELW